jgi:hypothetical protein
LYSSFHSDSLFLSKAETILKESISFTLSENSKKLLDTDSIILNQDCELGRGAYGVVYKGMDNRSHIHILHVASYNQVFQNL